MTIQRQYSLPNCTLILEGLSTTSAPSEVRPLLSILINAECHLAGQASPLTGGRDFFESLVTAVNRYGQEFLSGVHVPTVSDRPHLVKLHKINPHLHRLTVQQPSDTIQDHTSAAGDTGRTHQASPTEIDLTTVQLFDLVEAVDQFFADTRTLGDLSLQLAPASKRYTSNQEAIAKQAVPAAIGVSSLALAAIAFFFIPVPPVRRPQPVTNPGSTPVSTSPAPSPGTTPSSSPSPIAASPTASPSPVPVPVPVVVPITPSPTPVSSPTPSPRTDVNQIQAALNTPVEITDPTQLETLQKQLYNKLDQAIQTPNFDQSLVYRVSVGKDAAIVSYKPVNSPARDNAKQTPLPKLVYTPVAGSSATSEPTAQFRVVFKPSGALEVSPWYGYLAPSTPAPAASPLSTPEIADPAKLESLTPKLYKQVVRSWKDKPAPTFRQDLVYRVKVNQGGAIVGYEALNQPATDSLKEIPLPDLAKSNSTQSANAKEPVALFKVVFKPSGVLEVSPWRGY